MMTHKLREQLKHSVSHCTLDGRLWLNPNQSENLFDVVSRMRRFIVDSNSDWKRLSRKSANRNVAFIVGRTVETEEDNLSGVFFSHKVDLTNNNLFGFGLQVLGDHLLVCLHRIDPAFRLIFDQEKLDRESRPRKQRTEPEFLDRQAREQEAIDAEKREILLVLGVRHITELPDRKNLVEQERRLLTAIQSASPLAYYNWEISVLSARQCYALMLIQKRRMRHEFGLPDYRNVFGDVTLVQNALFMRSGILSNDDAPRRMLGYTGMPDLVCQRSV
jgi:hypothetical protein